MKIIEATYEILSDLSNSINTILKPIEVAGRTCYRSEDKITDDSCINFCKMLINRGHEAMLEHSQLSVRFTVDRAIANELVRHRICSFAQESTRYVNYSKGKFNNEIKVIIPDNLLGDTLDTRYQYWYSACKMSEDYYFKLLELNVKPEIARNVLPLSLASDIVCTANIREWRQIFKLRSSFNVTAHPQIQSIMDILLSEFKSKIPILFDDIQI